MSARWQRGLRYGVAGLLTLALYLASGAALQALGASLAWTSSLPFLLAVAFNYPVQRGWVFRDARPLRATLPRYLVMTGVGLAVNALVLLSFGPRLPLVWAQLMAVLLVVASNAALAFLWVFCAVGKPSRARVR